MTAQTSANENFKSSIESNWLLHRAQKIRSLLFKVTLVFVVFGVASVGSVLFFAKTMYEQKLVITLKDPLLNEAESKMRGLTFLFQNSLMTDAHVTGYKLARNYYVFNVSSQSKEVLEKTVQSIFVRLAQEFEDETNLDFQRCESDLQVYKNELDLAFLTNRNMPFFSMYNSRPASCHYLLGERPTLFMNLADNKPDPKLREYIFAQIDRDFQLLREISQSERLFATDGGLVKKTLSVNVVKLSFSIFALYLAVFFYCILALSKTDFTRKD